jgi:cysteine synthase
MLINSVLESVGNTPLISPKKLSSVNVFVKAEYLNPGGSVKDRVAKYIIESAENEGELKAGMVIIEATSGNTGIGLALVGVQKGYEVVCIMPENMSEERKKSCRLSEEISS